MLPAESENDALTDGGTYRRTDRRTLERNFLIGGYNIIPHTFKVARYKKVRHWNCPDKYILIELSMLALRPWLYCPASQE